jgi:hypothetical protein
MLTAVAPGSASIAATYTEGGRSVRVVVPVTVEEGTFTATPSTLNFGDDRAVFVGTNSKQDVTLTYKTTNETAKVKRVEIWGDFSQTNDCLVSSAKRTQTTCTISVTFSPKQAGRRQGTLTISDNFRTAPTEIALTGLAAAR